jgi:hypothetical protein
LHSRGIVLGILQDKAQQLVPNDPWEEPVRSLLDGIASRFGLGPDGG